MFNACASQKVNARRGVEDASKFTGRTFCSYKYEHKFCLARLERKYRQHAETTLYSDASLVGHTGASIVIQISKTQHAQEDADKNDSDCHCEEVSDSLLPTRLISAWFVNFPLCAVGLESRSLSLCDDSNLHEAFRAAWTCEVQDLGYKMVAVTSGPNEPRHVIGFPTAVSEPVAAVLVEAIVTGATGMHSVLRAALLPIRSGLSEVGRVFGIDISLASACQVACCRLRLNQIPHPFDLPLLLRDGDWIRLECNSDLVSEIPVQVDFAEVIKVHEFLDAHFTLPQFDLPFHFPWLPLSWQWACTPWWDVGILVSDIRIYYDGSCLRGGEHVSSGGCAVAAFVNTSQGWLFAGAVSSALPPGTTSYLAEINASVIAHKFLHDLLKLVMIGQTNVPTAEFCFDAETVAT